MGNAYSLYSVMKTAIKGRNKGGYTLSLLRTLKFDGSTQAIPVTNVYADAKWKSTSGDDSETHERFDWITVKDDRDNKNVVQILALLELKFPGAEGHEAVFLYMAADTEKVRKRQSNDEYR
jgi:hypothetical protein